MNEANRFIKLRSRDGDRVFEIWQRAKKNAEFPVGGRWGLETFQSSMALGRCLGLEVSGVLVAFILGQESGGGFEILQLATHPDFVRLGHMCALVGELKAKEYREIWLEVHSLNVPAQRLYEKCGFEVVGERKAYYADGGHALLMSWRNPLL